MAARLHGCTAARLHGCTAARLHGCTAARLHGCTAARLHCFAPPGVFWRSPKKNKKPRVVVFNIYIYIYMYILLKTFAGFARRNPPAKRYEAGSQGKERVIYDPFQPFQPVEKSPPWASQHLVCSPRST